MGEGSTDPVAVGWKKAGNEIEKQNSIINLYRSDFTAAI